MGTLLRNRLKWKKGLVTQSVGQNEITIVFKTLTLPLAVTYF